MTRRVTRTALWPPLLLCLAACSAEEATEPTITPPVAEPAYRPEQPPDFSNDALRDPKLATAHAPELFKVRFETTKGDVVVVCERELAPHGVDRFYNLVKIGFFQDIAFFRAIQGFMLQFGLSGDPEIAAAWSRAYIPDDPVKTQNRRGFLTFAMSGLGTRTTQLFLNLVDNHEKLDDYSGTAFAPIGRIQEGLAVVDQLYTRYGEVAAMGGRGPAAESIERKGNDYLREHFPEIDYLIRASIVE